MDIRGNTFILHCANDFKRGYIETLFLKNIKAALHDIFSMEFEVSILDDAGLAALSGGEPKKQSDRFTSRRVHLRDVRGGPVQQAGLRRIRGSGRAPRPELQSPVDLRGFGPWQNPFDLRHRQRHPEKRPQVQDRLRQGRRSDQ